MLCPKCGYYADREDSVCPECGEILNAEAGLPNEGAEAIRQGRKARKAILDAAARQSAETRRRRRSGASHATVEMPAVQDEWEETDFPVYPVSEETGTEDEDDREAVFERRRRQVYDEEAGHDEQERADAEWIGRGGQRRFGMVNWMKVSIIALAVLILAGAGGWLFLENTDSGQKILARLGKTATSSALWSLGEEQMNSGDLESAIRSFEKAKAQDEIGKYVDVDGLLMLCSAYEAVGKTDAAAALYEKISNDTPARPEAYINLIRILRNSGKTGDLARAAELMEKAYKYTNEASFQTQRKDLIPQVPKTKDAGIYNDKIQLTITSDQGYDVYYTFDDKAELPYGGILYTEPITLTEKKEDGPKTWNLRTVAVNGELVSEELKAKYKIIMPSPQTPLCNLAPGAYKSKQKVKLRPGKDNEKDDDIKIYYTVDGSIPDSDSPLYEGEPILLPSGRSVTIRAIAVNRYNKTSNVMEYTFRIDAKPYPLTPWTIDETIAGLELYKTTIGDFESKYGEGTRVEMEQPKGFENECRKYEYPWGYTVMTLSGRNWVLVELYFTDETFKAPRGTGTGDPMNFVVSKFRDMGQLENKESGNRGLYHMDNTSDGKIYYDKGTKTWRILYRIPKSEHWYRLEYFTDQSGTITAVDWKYHIPEE